MTDPNPERPAAGREPATTAAGDAGRRSPVIVRLTTTERETWHAAARAEGRAETAPWVRDLVTAHIEQRPAPFPPDPSVDRARGELVRIGSNLNQITHALNVAVRGGPGVELGQVLAVVDATRAELAKVRDELRDRA